MAAAPGTASSDSDPFAAAYRRAWQWISVVLEHRAVDRGRTGGCGGAFARRGGAVCRFPSVTPRESSRRGAFQPLARRAPAHKSGAGGGTVPAARRSGDIRFPSYPGHLAIRITSKRGRFPDLDTWRSSSSKRAGQGWQNNRNYRLGRHEFGRSRNRPCGGLDAVLKSHRTRASRGCLWRRCRYHTASKRLGGAFCGDVAGHRHRGPSATRRDRRRRPSALAGGGCLTGEDHGVAAEGESGRNTSRCAERAIQGISGRAA